MTRPLSRIPSVGASKRDAQSILNRLNEIIHRAEHVAGRLETAISAHRRDADQCAAASQVLHERLQLGAELLSALDVACRNVRKTQAVNTGGTYHAADTEDDRNAAQPQWRDEVSQVQSDIEAAITRARHLREEAESAWTDMASRAAEAARTLQRDLTGDLTTVANRLLELAREVKANQAIRTVGGTNNQNADPDRPSLRLHRPNDTDHQQSTGETTSQKIDAG